MILSDGGKKESLDTEVHVKIEDFTNKELSARNRFSRESFYIRNLLVGVSLVTLDLRQTATSVVL